MPTRALMLLVLASATPALAQEAYKYGHIRHVEGGTTIQRANEASAEEAFRNLPFLPGDRLWTDQTGRAELQFPGGSLARMDSRSKLDYLEHEGEGQDDRVVLRLWSGSVILHLRDDAPAFEIETPSALVEASERGVVRVDVASGETRLSVLRGEALIEAGRKRVRVEQGERTYARPGEAPQPPGEFDGREADDFARWDGDREAQTRRADDSRYLPEEVAPYAGDLASNGSWFFEAGAGYVWQPYVPSGWSPYLNGRWAWSPYGWTWVANEPWGWAPFHYGRWDHSGALGWYWIPGRAWSPAWVSWSVGSDYVGWCPLGRHDRPVTARGERIAGRAVPRGSISPWVFTQRSNLAGREVARHRVDLPETATRGLVEVARGRVDRQLRVVDGDVAVPRAITSRPTPGDTIPELRSDPATTIPFPVARRRYPSEEERRQGERQREQQATPRRFGRDATPPEPGGTTAGLRSPESQGTEAPRPPEAEARTGARPAGASGERRRPSPLWERPQPQERAVEGERRVRDRESAPPSADREVLRRMFGPLSGRRGEGSRNGAEGAAARTRPGSEPRTVAPPPPPRAEPRRDAPAPPSEEGGGSRAVRRKKDGGE